MPPRAEINGRRGKGRWRFDSVCNFVDGESVSAAVPSPGAASEIYLGIIDWRAHGNSDRLMRRAGRRLRGIIAHIHSRRRHSPGRFRSTRAVHARAGRTRGKAGEYNAPAVRNALPVCPPSAPVTPPDRACARPARFGPVRIKG